MRILNAYLMSILILLCFECALADPVSELEGLLSKRMTATRIKKINEFVDNLSPQSVSKVKNPKVLVAKLQKAMKRVKSANIAMGSRSSGAHELMRKLRYLTDRTVQCTSGKNLNKTVNVLDPSKTLSESDFKPGDVFVMRGGSSISATISRITKNKSQFSHAAIITEKDGKKYVTETLIETGAKNTPLKEWLASHKELPRAMILRPKKGHLGAAAAEKCYDLIEGHKNSKGKKAPIPYDFEMKLGAADRLFCSELVNHCLRNFRGGARYSTPVQSEYRKRRAGDVLSALNIKSNVTKTLAPGDFQFNGQFEKVAEFVNPSKAYELMLDDVMFDEVLKWSDRSGRNFTDPNTLRVVSQLKHSRLITAAAKKKGYNLDMPSGAIGTMVALKRTKEMLFSDVQGALKYDSKKGCENYPSHQQITAATTRALKKPGRIGFYFRKRKSLIRRIGDRIFGGEN